MAAFVLSFILAITVCPDHRCKTVELPAPNLYLCEARARDLVELARKDRRVSASCLIVTADKAPA